MSKYQKGFGIVEIIIVIILVAGMIGLVWYAYSASQKKDTSDKATPQTPSQQQAPAIPGSWIKFSEASIGLTFQYPDSWGEAHFEVMNPQPDELNKTFYKITFEKKHRIITITPKTSAQPHNTSLAQLKDSIKNYPESRYVLVDSSDYAATVVPSNGNQASELYAAKLISLPNIDADTLVLVDSIGYESVGTCQADTYASCYSNEDKSEIKLFLQELKSD